MHQSAHPPPATPADQNPMHLFPARPSPPSRAEPESTFSRIISMNPEPSTALAPTQAPPPHQHPMHQTAHPPPATPAHQHPMHQFSARSSPPSRAESESTFSRTNSHESGTRHGARANPHATVAPTPRAPDRTPAPNDAGASTPHAPIRGPAEPAIPRGTRIHVFANQPPEPGTRHSRQPTRHRRTNIPCTRPHTPQRSRRTNTPCTNSRPGRASHPAPTGQGPPACPPRPTDA